MDALIAFYHAHRIPFLLTLVSFTTLLFHYLYRDRRLHTISGPPGYPLIGLGYKLPPGSPALFRQWAQQYGEVFRLRVGWYNWVVLNTPEAVREVLEKQAVHTSSKAPSPMGHDIVTAGRRMPTMPYGPHWRAQRSVVRQLTTVPMTTTFIPTQEFEAKQLLHDLAIHNTDQRSFYQHLRRYAFSIIMTNAFGTRVQGWDHPDARNAIRSQAILRATSRPGAFLVDEIPPLAWLPTWLQPGRNRALAAAAEVREIKMGLWRRIEKQHAAGAAPHCFARTVLEQKEAWFAQGLTEEDLAWVAGAVVEAGFETTAATLNSLVLQLAAHPEVQERAYAELQRVAGDTRAPVFADHVQLPYIRACVKEILRMNPILAPGIRHYADQDVVYKGHVIPKGTVLVANTAFLHYDPERFDRPFEFRPERYLDHPLYSSEYAVLGDPYKRDHFTFSTGRRTCPGARLAENSLMIALAAMLWAFEIRPPLVNGKEEAMDLSDKAYPDGGFTIPKPFAARFVPRTEKTLAIIKEQWAVAQEKGYELRGMAVDVNGVVL
ncbi:cytochrome P450 [Aspergillus homomorphus CBS 101889]|uniref:Putative O-methylsterigmatocystin oxidoreductase n=1 Tax=Aspergillus homomorphus (strain CBS 101889) TaxID=1450537 RepID=A0A395I9U3_ASPHC|nr:putative O-methylsterigmatocystin oxidoreductase [Aspergillus homomorphus CBS 101889]RAL16796.1 putative O-methylsterigmatocystin oxidoreductase [Aspergillus homomorphus CBS 101889]